MKSHPYFLWLIIFLTTTLEHQLLAHSLHHFHTGPLTNVTKHLCFSNFHPKSTDIKLLGSATISDHHNGLIQIPEASPTTDHAYQAGRALYSSSIRVFDPLTQTPASFNTTFSFQFTTASTAAATTTRIPVSGYSRGGSGLAFVLVADEFTVGRAGPWLGMLNDACDTHNKVFGIEFDTSHDPEFGDPNDDHVGINLASIVSFKSANLSESGVSLHDNSVHRAWIMYNGHRRWIDVYVGLDRDLIPSHPILSSSLNLAPFLKEYMFVGFSASTGDSTQIHNILSWNFSSSVQAYLRVPSRRTCHRNVVHQVSKYSRIAHSNRPSSFLIFMCVVGICTVALLSLCYNGKRREISSLAFVIPDKKQRPIPPSKPRRFPILEIYSATRGFSRTEQLGSDSNGVLYRGTLPNGRYVSMKRFSPESLNSLRFDWNRILSKINAITKVSHPNLVPIRGWCFDKRESIIIYDYFQNGSLDKWLFGLGVLPWTRRFKLIKDIAESLSFLHSQDLVHGNLKTSSVFLDMNYRAVLGDYSFFSESNRFDLVSSKKSEVLGYGVLVLEIVAGKSSNDDEWEMGLLRFAWGMHERGEKVKVVDERLGSGFELEQAIRVVEIGLSCTLGDGNERPCMEEVVQFLNMQRPIPKLPASRPIE